ncbi:hypothetical protein [Desulfoscipio gibsoniae]
MYRINERTEDVTGIKDHEGPSVAVGDDDFLKKDAGNKEKAKGDYTRVTILSYDEADPG